MANNTILNKDAVAKTVEKFGKSAANTGQTEVQIALLTRQIQQLTEHLKTHKKDFSCQRGLLKSVGQRRRLLDFLKNSAPGRYVQVLSDLELRK